jgi:hypothetical protein
VLFPIAGHDHERVRGRRTEHSAASHLRQHRVLAQPQDGAEHQPDVIGARPGGSIAPSPVKDTTMGWSGDGAGVPAAPQRAKAR